MFSWVIEMEHWAKMGYSPWGQRYCNLPEVVLTNALLSNCS